MTDRIYLDWNATAPLRPEARDAMAAALDLAGNPSSVHAEGRAARQLIEQCARAGRRAGRRRAEAGDVSPRAEPKPTIWRLPLPSRLPISKAPRDRLLVSAIEHPSVRAGGQFVADAVEEIPVTTAGMVDLRGPGTEAGSPGAAASAGFRDARQ